MSSPGRRRLLLLLAVLAVSPWRAVEAQIPRGPVIEITAAGTTSEFVTGAAVLESGDFLLVWTSRPPQGPTRVRFRLFRGNGSPRSPELGVGSPPWDQFGGRVALRADGRFVIVWTENVPGAFRVLGRLFAPTLRPLGSPFRLTPELRGNQREPDVAMAADGRFVAVWSSDHRDTLRRHHPDIYARRFTPAGRPLGPELLVNAENADHADEDQSPRVAVAGNGDFVVVWESWQGDGYFYDVALQRFAANGTPRGELLFLEGKEGRYSRQVRGAVAVAEDGGAMAVWTDHGSDIERGDPGVFEGFLGIVGRRLAADGTSLGVLVHVNDVAPGRQENPEIVRRPGGFYVVWESSGSEQRPGGIFARRLRLNGLPAVGGDLRISAASAAVSGPVVALNSLGIGVVAWTERHADPEGFRVVARAVLPR